MFPKKHMKNTVFFKIVISRCCNHVPGYLRGAICSYLTINAHSLRVSIPWMVLSRMVLLFISKVIGGFDLISYFLFHSALNFLEDILLTLVTLVELWDTEKKTVPALLKERISLA